MDIQALWQAALGELELTLSKANFTTWFKNTFLSEIEGTKAVVSVPNTFTKAWMEKKYHDQIVKALRNASNLPIREVSYRVEVRNTTVLPLDYVATQPESAPAATSVTYAPPNSTAFASAPTSKAGADVGLNPRYQFSTFVVGKNNELAHAASTAVATKPGEVHNPLFVYGSPGMGKTHLLQAIGHHALHINPNLKVKYVTCEKFTNEFIQALRSGHADSFKDKYRLVDILLVDDIQFLAGREGTQDEFFHTFNHLHQGNKQIVLSSDRPPKDISNLETRLQSRLEWGMMADISKADFETRVAILQAKAREKNYPLSTEILHAIAGAIQSNIRELEGALNKIVAYHQFKNLLPSLETIQPILQSFAPTITKRTITPRVLLETVTEYYEITMDEILGKSRERRLAFPRQIAMYLLREEAKCSYPSIGDQVGGRDHTTAMHACDKISSLLKSDEQLKRDLSIIREKIYSSGGTRS
ncbi:chromosomal replication initiator protein DnaA [Candidatus Uhrbacteria bacterium]|nr:MAG: chromosomal replication initiator protein DnaA [Candidatus Uhrbacteria bacterium]